MKYSNNFKVLFVINMGLLVSTLELHPKASISNSKTKTSVSTRKSGKTPRFTTSSAVLNDAVKDIKASLNNPDGKLSSICCTYKFNGIKVISKETKKYYDNYRKKPNYSKTRFLDEERYQTDKIIQVKFNKHSEQVLITYKDPSDKNNKIYVESLDAAQFQLV